MKSLAGGSFRHVAAFGLFLILLGAAPGLRQIRWDFEAEQPGEIARGFKRESGRWEVVLDGDNHVVAQRAENRVQDFNLTLIEQTSYKDVNLSVRMKAVAGENERGGGVVWRAKDRNNFYLVRYNPYVNRYTPRPPNVRLYKVRPCRGRGRWSVAYVAYHDAGR
jgi:hypothetical protein